MICKNCSQDMNLRHYQDHDRNFERFIYECSKCGFIDNAMPNINLKELHDKKSKQILQDIKEFGLLIEKEALEFLIRHPSPFVVLSMFSRRNNKLITLSILKKGAVQQ